MSRIFAAAAVPPTVPDVTDALAHAAAAATRAPSIHNTQPWRWQVGDACLDLYLDRRRQLDRTDPLARLAILSCGAALHHARTALTGGGWRVEVVEFPDPADPDHLAHISVYDRASASPEALRRVRAMRERHTDRRPVTATPVGGDVLLAVTVAAEEYGGWLRELPRDRVVELGSAMTYAQRAEVDDDRWRAELAYWAGGTRPDRAGVPDAAIPDRPTQTAVPSRDFGYPGALAEALNTTPDALELHRMLKAFLAGGAKCVSMEVSSHGLAQGRVNGVAFGCALFTNLSHDHLDYHGSMQAYAAAKSRLFDTPGLRTAVLNLDDAVGLQLAQRLAARGVRTIGYSLEASAIAPGSVAEFIAAHRITAQTLELRSSWGKATGSVSQLGRFNLSNALGVLGCLVAYGVPFHEAVELLGALPSVPGRMQKIGDPPHASCKTDWTSDSSCPILPGGKLAQADWNYGDTHGLHLWNETR